MSNDLAKFINSQRRHKTDVAVARQVKIARSNGVTYMDRQGRLRQPHRMAKHHAMNCGKPGCMLCGNPRKLFKELTAQENRLYQDVEATTNKHSNGLQK